MTDNKPKLICIEDQDEYIKKGVNNLEEWVKQENSIEFYKRLKKIRIMRRKRAWWPTDAISNLKKRKKIRKIIIKRNDGQII